MWGRADSKTQRKERGAPALWLLFLYIFPSPLGLPHVNWAAQECCLFYVRSSLPRTFLCPIFSGFLRPSLLATAILDSCFLFLLPNIRTLILSWAPSWPPLNLIASQRLHLQIPSPWWLRVSAYEFGGGGTNIQSIIVPDIKTAFLGGWCITWMMTSWYSQVLFLGEFE